MTQVKTIEQLKRICCKRDTSDESSHFKCKVASGMQKQDQEKEEEGKSLCKERARQWKVKKCELNINSC